MSKKSPPIPIFNSNKPIRRFPASNGKAPDGSIVSMDRPVLLAKTLAEHALALKAANETFRQWLGGTQFWDAFWSHLVKHAGTANCCIDADKAGMVLLGHAPPTLSYDKTLLYVELQVRNSRISLPIPVELLNKFDQESFDAWLDSGVRGRNVDRSRKETEEQIQKALDDKKISLKDLRSFVDALWMEETDRSINER